MTNEEWVAYWLPHAPQLDEESLEEILHLLGLEQKAEGEWQQTNILGLLQAASK